MTTTTLTDEQVDDIRAYWETGEVTQAALAEKFGVSEAHISRIVNGRTRTSTNEDDQ